MAKTDVTRLLAGEGAGTAWQLYEQQFAALNMRAVQRHLLRGALSADAIPGGAAT
ncbi:hypothetical protein KZZ52_33430 [Dactylosporangium sp. AC04546]|uniref:hypothetical protein n=1 Tax=Dactylosporangium sp. AC04546 TaxID=2862460 RepID=UPI001EDF9FE1|nr:hypothetical protein [Dactylosporangium sp. AC04546]WVK78881.1 hypothetical protein KZZ52_33430 [Dactylosporangium sp. AC04546]